MIFISPSSNRVVRLLGLALSRASDAASASDGPLIGPWIAAMCP